MKTVPFTSAHSKVHDISLVKEWGIYFLRYKFMRDLVTMSNLSDKFKEMRSLASSIGIPLKTDDRVASVNNSVVAYIEPLNDISDSQLEEYQNQINR